MNEVQIQNPIDRQLSSLLQIFISVGIIGSIIALFLQIGAVQANNTPSLGVLAPIVSLICYLIGLALLRFDRFRISIYLVTAGLILGLGSALFLTGIQSSAVTLLAFALAITLAGLVGRRAHLLFAIGLSISVVAGIALLEHLSPPLAGYDVPAGDPIIERIVGFTLILIVLGLFLDRSGQALRGALATAVSREQALEQEIADRRRIEAALRENEQRYRLIAENSSDLIGLLDLEGSGQRLYASPSYRAVLGYDPEEFLGLNGASLVHPDDLNAIAEQMRQLILNGHGRAIYRLRHADGSWRWIETHASAITQDGLRYAVTAGRDITDRKHLEAQLMQSQRLEGVGRLAGGIAHDFNNLLTAIMGNTDLARDTLPASHPARDELDEIAKSAARAAELTRQLLAFARKQVIELRVIDLNQLILDMDKLLRRLIGAHIELVTLTEPKLWRVRADPGQLEQVVINLAVNARDAMHNGGKLTIETRNVVLDHDCAHRHISVSPGSYVMLAISDTGTGMDEVIQAQIFEPFFTTKAPGRGTGLGLATCYGIVKQHGGNIWPYSEPGHGSSFKIYLPRVEAPVEDRSLPATDDLPYGTETILLAEDEPSVRLLAARVLRAQGYNVLEAENGEAALQLAREWSGPPIALLLTDVVMPRMSGKILAEHIQALFPKSAVLFISGYTDNAIVHHGQLDPGIVFLQKPFSPAALARKVRQVLDLHAA